MGEAASGILADVGEGHHPVSGISSYIIPGAWVYGTGFMIWYYWLNDLNCGSIQDLLMITKTQDTVLGQGAQPSVTMSQSPISRASFDPADRSLGKSVQGGCTSHPDRGAMFIKLCCIMLYHVVSCCIYSHHYTTRFFMFFLFQLNLILADQIALV